MDSGEYYGTFKLNRNDRGLYWQIQFWECDTHTHIKKSKEEGYNRMPIFKESIFLSFEFKEGDLDEN